MDTKPKAPVKTIRVVVLAVVLIIVLGLAAYLFQTCGGNVPAPVKEKAEKATEYIVPTAQPESQLPGVNNAPADHPPRTVQAPAATDVCNENRKKLLLIFSYLDRRDYITSRQLAGGSLEYLKGILARLLESPPSVMLETDSLLSILRNRAHFYRVLGKNDTLLLRDILRNEGDMLESSFEILYQTLTLRDKCKNDGLLLDLPLNKVYPYAVFFLDTLGGSSYLMRRDSQMRMLARYYCVLVIDQANRLMLNSIGLNIIPPLDILIKDMKSAANLKGKLKYNHTLNGIRARY